jgi:hypothetical protein
MQSREIIPMRTYARPDTVRILLVAVLAIGAMIVATALVGPDIALPSYELVPDPAGTLPF